MTRKRPDATIREWYEKGYMHQKGCECGDCEFDRWFYQRPYDPFCERMPVLVKNGKLVNRPQGARKKEDAT